jgi:hypothetical protein
MALGRARDLHDRFVAEEPYMLCRSGILRGAPDRPGSVSLNIEKKNARCGIIDSNAQDLFSSLRIRAAEDTHTGVMG